MASKYKVTIRAGFFTTIHIEERTPDTLETWIISYNASIHAMSVTNYSKKSIEGRKKTLVASYNAHNKRECTIEKPTPSKEVIDLATKEFIRILRFI